MNAAILIVYLFRVRVLLEQRIRTLLKDAHAN